MGPFFRKIVCFFLFPGGMAPVDDLQRGKVEAAAEKFLRDGPEEKKEPADTILLKALARQRAEKSAASAAGRVVPEKPCPRPDPREPITRYSITSDDLTEEYIRGEVRKRMLSGRHPPDLNARHLSFSAMVAKLVRDRFHGLAPVVYGAAHISRQAYSAIVSNGNHVVAKRTAVAFAFGLRLDEDEAKVLLEMAGYAFSPMLLEDVIFLACLQWRIYDLDEVNVFLEKYGLKPL